MEANSSNLQVPGSLRNRAIWILCTLTCFLYIPLAGYAQNVGKMGKRYKKERFQVEPKAVKEELNIKKRHSYKNYPAKHKFKFRRQRLNLKERPPCKCYFD